MSETEIIRKLSSSLHAAASSLSSAEKWARMLASEKGVELDEVKSKASSLSYSATASEEYDEDVKILEGVFDGQNMIGSDSNVYPVPANYASKSKLVEGDTLKLTIQPNGAFLYKQIEQIVRVMVTGQLVLDGSQYQVLADDGKTYKVLYASITFFKAMVGDTVTVILPAGQEASWGAIENVIPVAH